MPVRAESTGRVVFHADDFGMNAAVNLGILTAFREGLLTSTSLLANAPAAEAACQEWPALVAEYTSNVLRSSDLRRQLGEPRLPFDLGVHLNLTQGRPLTGTQYPAELLNERGHYPGIGRLFYRLNRATSAQLRSVEAELHAQIEWIFDRGLQPTHVNGHQYIELIPQISAMIPEILRRYSIPTVRVAFERGLVRNVLMQGDVAGWGLALVKHHYARAFHRQMLSVKVAFPDRFYGTSHAGRINRELLLRFLSQSPKSECTEIGVHPAVESTSSDVPSDDPWFDPLAKSRPTELDWLCGAELPEVLKNGKRTLGRLGSFGTMVQVGQQNQRPT